MSQSLNKFLDSKIAAACFMALISWGGIVVNDHFRARQVESVQAEINKQIKRDLESVKGWNIQQSQSTEKLANQVNENAKTIAVIQANQVFLTEQIRDLKRNQK